MTNIRFKKCIDILTSGLRPYAFVFSIVWLKHVRKNWKKKRQLT